MANTSVIETLKHSRQMQDANFLAYYRCFMALLTVLAKRSLGTSTREPPPGWMNSTTTFGARPLWHRHLHQSQRASSFRSRILPSNPRSCRPLPQLHPPFSYSTASRTEGSQSPNGAHRSPSPRQAELHPPLLRITTPLLVAGAPVLPGRSNLRSTIQDLVRSNLGDVATGVLRRRSDVKVPNFSSWGYQSLVKISQDLSPGQVRPVEHRLLKVSVSIFRLMSTTSKESLRKPRHMRQY